eukprot:gene9610-12942_t
MIIQNSNSRVMHGFKPCEVKNNRLPMLRFKSALLSTLPEHKVVPMPALSPTMETGSIAKWNLKEGDKFEAGTAICEVETDKATVTYDATEDGYLAKIIVTAGEIKVGQPIMITVDEASDVAAFASYVSSAVTATPAASTPVPTTPTVSVTTNSSTAVTTTSASPSVSTPSDTGRIFASPFAKKIAKESNLDLPTIKRALDSVGGPSGPNGRIIADDVIKAKSLPSLGIPAAVSTTTVAAPKAPSPVISHGVSGVYSDFELQDIDLLIANKLTVSKQIVPHYYLSVDINLSKINSLANDLNKKLKKDESLVKPLDFLIKAAALAMKKVPDVNASWMDTFVRKYEQVDINLMSGNASYIAAPVIKDVSSKGLLSISAEVNAMSESSSLGALSLGTFSIHNLGKFGVKSAAPIVLTPQACALSFGEVIDTVIPSKATEEGWEVAPVLVATLSCDHRVVDGAVGAAWLAAFKELAEDPLNMLL